MGWGSRLMAHLRLPPLCAGYMGLVDHVKLPIDQIAVDKVPFHASSARGSLLGQPPSHGKREPP